MSVEDWARRESKRQYPTDFDPQERTSGPVEAEAGQWGIVHAFSALLSERAEIAAGKVIAGYFPGHEVTFHLVRAVLQAAIQAVTEGDTE